MKSSVPSVSSTAWTTFFTGHDARARRRGQDWGAEEAVRAVSELLASNGRPFFAFVNFMKPHFPYNPPTDLEGFSPEEARHAIDVLIPYRIPLAFDDEGGVARRQMQPEDVDMLRRPYSGEVAYLDRRLGELLHRVHDTGRIDDIVIVVVADHGEHLGEHGLVGHVDSVHEELLHVLFLVLGPADLVGRGMEDARVSTQSLHEAVLAWTGGEPPALRGPAPIVADYEGVWHHAGSVRRMSPGGDHGASKAVRVIYDDDWKLVHSADGGERLYDLRDDPNETGPGTDDRAGTERMRRKLTAVLAGRAPSGPDATGPAGCRRDPSVESELRALGYL